MPDSILYLQPLTHKLLITSFSIICVAGAFALAPEDWGALRTVLAGLFTGIGSYYCLFINRIMVA